MIQFSKPVKKDMTALMYLLVGLYGTGKTRFAGTFPGASLWVDLEGRAESAIDPDKGDMRVTPSTFEEFMEVLDYLVSDNFTNSHFCNLIVDSWTLLYEKIQMEVITKFEKDTNTYKKWDVLNKQLFRIADRLKDVKARGLNVVMTASGTLQHDTEGKPFYSVSNKREQTIDRYVDNIILFKYEDKQGYRAYTRFSSDSVCVKVVEDINKGLKGNDYFDPSKGFSATLSPLLFTQDLYQERRKFHLEASRVLSEKVGMLERIAALIESKKLAPKDIVEAKSRLGFGVSPLKELDGSQIRELVDELKI